jgi:hypothetical protein
MSAAIVAFGAYNFSNKLNLSPQLPLLSSSGNELSLSLRSLGVAPDIGFAKVNPAFMLQDMDAIRLSVSDLDAVAYKMQREEGAVLEGAKLGDGADSPSQDQNGSNQVAARGTEAKADVSIKGKGSGKATPGQTEGASQRDAPNRLTATDGSRDPIEINTRGPREPRLPERESPSVTDEFRDPFARESVSPSPNFPRGNEVRPVFEEPLPQEKILKVQSDTTVRSKPSVFGEDLADLRVGDSVLAVSKVGQWVRIRSKKGLSGFVLDKALSGG